MADTIDINVSQTTETITINSTPNLTTININTITGGGGGAVTSVNGQTGDVVIATSDNNFTNALKTKLDGIATGAEVNVNADWNAASGDAQILNKPTIPSIAGLATVTYVDNQDALKVDKVAGKGLSTNDYTTLEQTKLSGIQAGAEVNVNADWNATSGDAQILNKPTIPAAQVNSDWNSVSGVSQILNKPTIPTQTSQLTNNGADGTNPFITALDIPTTGQASTLVREVKNMTGATLTKGTVVYISGANGNKALVSKALATTDALSSRTFGLLQSNILNNGLGYCVIIGDLSGLDTSSFTEGAQLYLSGVTAGTYTETKILAPTHLVYVGKVTRVHPTQGQIEVGIQNGYELAEIHDVALSSVANNQLLSFDSATSLWKNKSVTTADIADSTNKRYQTDNQQTFNDATSSIQTQINSKPNFTAPNQQVYTGTITWTGTTAPSGATNHTYNWIRIGNLVTLKITLVYATTGAALTAVNVTLPTDCPTPLKPTGLTAASNNLYTGSGLFSNSLTGTPSASNRVLLRSNAANNGFEISSNGPSAGYLFSDIIVQYFTS
jgi:hypothetical protein